MDVVGLILGGTAAMGAFATAGAIVGGAKGRHAAGAIWGMLLGPIGLVVACLLEPEIGGGAPPHEEALGPGLGSSKKVDASPKRQGERPSLRDL